jgi:hypothetical protein
VASQMRSNFEAAKVSAAATAEARVEAVAMVRGADQGDLEWAWAGSGYL